MYTCWDKNKLAKEEKDIQDKWQHIIMFYHLECNTSLSSVTENKRACLSTDKTFFFNVPIGWQVEEWREYRDTSSVNSNLWVTELPNMSDRTCHVLPRSYLT